MLNIGNYNTLKIIKILSFGAYLDGGDGKGLRSGMRSKSLFIMTMRGG